MTHLLEADVVVVGGGVTGVAVLRDLALRGVQAVLVERFDLGTRTSGRWHGLLHSGARNAVRDQESARECIEENTTLRRIAPHTIEDIGGLFVLLPGDDQALLHVPADGGLQGLADRGVAQPQLPGGPRAVVEVGVASVAETVARVRGRQPKLCRESVRTLGHPHLYDGSKATKELGLRYTPLRQAMEATVRWYVQQGLVARPLPRIPAEAKDAPAEPTSPLFEPPSGREREPSP